MKEWDMRWAISILWIFLLGLLSVVSPSQMNLGAAERGLAEVQQVGGTYIAFAAAPGQEASDGMGRNGTYTKHILRFIEKPGLSIDHLFTEVRKSVWKETGGRQLPWATNGQLGNFYFALYSVP